MNLAIIGTPEQHQAFAKATATNSCKVQYIASLAQLSMPYNAIFHFSFMPSADAFTALEALNTCVFINSVTEVLPPNSTLIRYNGWATLCNYTNLEIACTPMANPNYINVLNSLAIAFTQVPNTVGMVTPRIVSMLVNEAYYALHDGLSTASEIDIAMQLGTNYPYGPITWGNLIGLPFIIQLLQALQLQSSRYTLAPNLLS